MSRQFTTDWYAEIQKGNIPGHSIQHKFGRNDGVPNASWEAVSLLSTTTSFLSAATAVRVKAGGNAADDTAGLGAQEITIEGLDETGAFVSEAVATAGASASTGTTATYIRVFRAYVSACGAYGASNTAAVTIENSAGGTDIIYIAIEEGQTQYGLYTIPLGKTGYLLSATVTVDAAKAADIRMFHREDILDTTPPVAAKRIKLYFDGVLGALSFKPVSPGSAMAALTDVWFEARGGGAGTEVSVDFEILLVDN